MCIGTCVAIIEARQHVVAGRPIVGDSWVNACGRSGSFVDPVDHLLIDSAAHKKFGFDMRTSYERAQHHLLLKGLNVFFTPGTLLLKPLSIPAEHVHQYPIDSQGSHLLPDCKSCLHH